MTAIATLEATPPKICAIFPGALGDFICFLPTLRALDAAAQVDLFARTEFADLAPSGVKVRSLECHEISALFLPDAAKNQKLCKFFGAYNATYSWHGSQEIEFIRSLQFACQGRAHVFAFRASGSNIHQADYYRSCIPEMDQAPDGLSIAPRPEAVAWIENYWVRHSIRDQPVLVLAPGSGAREKNWSLASYCAVAEWWRRQIHGTVIALIGPVEEERRGFDRLLDYSIAGRHLSLGQVAALLCRSTIYLGNDSGITHLAAAVGARTVALFGPSNVGQWAPRGERVTILSRDVECSPCDLTMMKNCPHRKCLTAFPVEKVVEELANLPEMANLTRLGPGIRV